MKYITRLILALVLIAALLPLGSASADQVPADPNCAAVASSLGASYESIWLDGAVTCVLVPKLWNRDMVLFAHGYVDARQPIGIPWGQLTSTQPSLPALVLNLGYAFGTTSYSKNGLAIKQGVSDIVNLVSHIRSTNRRVNRIFLTGASEGGLVTMLSVERYPQLFTGALSTCGPIGSFPKQVQYWGDFRVAFDQFFPNALKNPVVPPGFPPVGGSTPIFINPLVVQGWESFRDGVVVPQLLANPAGVQGLISATGVPIDPADPVNTSGQSILGLLYYNVEATNDGRLTLVPGANIVPPSLAGNPYSNPSYTDGYPQGIQPDPAALAEINANYETSGKLSRQVVVMHTTGDPIIPFAQSLLYLKKAALQNSLGDVTLIPIVRYGHCNFQPAEIVFGFYTMVLRSTFLPFSSVQIQAALPDQKSRDQFAQLKKGSLP